MSGSDHKSTPAIDDVLEDEEDLEEFGLDICDELEESDEREVAEEELMTTNELACDDALDVIEEELCIDELIAKLELLKDELVRTCELDWDDDDEVTSDEELLDSEEETTCNDELDDGLELDSPAPPHAVRINTLNNPIPCFKTSPYNDRKKVMAYIV